MLRFMILLGVLSLNSWAARDGAWNGKPYDKAKLEAGVKKGQPAALAEWAYCSKNGVAGIRYDKALIVQRAEEAAKKNDSLGLFMMGSCYESGLFGKRDDPRSLKFIQASANAGHPEGIWKLGVYYRLGIMGVKRDHKKGMGMIEKARKEGCLDAYWSLATVYRKGELGEIDLERSAEALKKLIAHGHPIGAEEIARARVRESRYRSLHNHFSKEDYAKSEEILRSAAQLGQPHMMYYLGFMLVREGRPHEGFPLLIRASRVGKGVYRSMLGFPSRMKRAKDSNIRCLAMDYQTEWRIADLAYREGARDKDIQRLVADSILMSDVRTAHPREAEALKMLTGMINSSPRGDCEASHSLARYLCSKFFFQKGTKKNAFERGMAHYSLHGSCPPAAHWLAMFYDRKDPRTRDVAKALAAFHRAIEINTGGWLHVEKTAQKRLLKEATAEEKKEAEMLIADEWPYGKKHRKKAFLYLQKIGDIPKGQKFDPEFRFPQDAEGL